MRRGEGGETARHHHPQTTACRRREPERERDRESSFGVVAGVTGRNGEKGKPTGKKGRKRTLRRRPITDAPPASQGASCAMAAAFDVDLGLDST
ncbi:hypothetical protein U1Q18_022608 [Sarracenia purpurea var. burkii]